jgi:hypothetical protein
VRITVVLFLGGCGAALIGAEVRNDRVLGYDVLRAVVLGQAVVIVVLYGYGALRCMRSAATAADGWERTAWRGRAAILLGVLVLLCDEVVRVALRLGNSHFNWRTPTVQVALWLLLVAWRWAIRRFWTPPGSSRDVGHHPPRGSP